MSQFCPPSFGSGSTDLGFHKGVQPTGEPSASALIFAFLDPDPCGSWPETLGQVQYNVDPPEALSVEYFLAEILRPDVHTRIDSVHCKIKSNPLKPQRFSTISCVKFLKEFLIRFVLNADPKSVIHPIAALDPGYAITMEVKNLHIFVPLFQSS